jgi:competence protein ComEC
MHTILAQMPVSWLGTSFPARVDRKIRNVSCYSGQRWVWDGVVFEMLHPQPYSVAHAALSDNNRSCVLKITSASGSLLLTGDIERRVEMEMIEKMKNNQASASLKSDILIAPHHGSKTSSSVEFINAVGPDLTIFTAGYLNRFRHPRPEIEQRYADAQSEIMRSDYHGAITLNFFAKVSERAVKATSWREQNRRYWHDSY